MFQRTKAEHFLLWYSVLLPDGDSVAKPFKTIEENLARKFRFCCINVPVLLHFQVDAKKLELYLVLPNEYPVGFRSGRTCNQAGQDDFFMRKFHQRIILVDFRISDEDQSLDFTDKLAELHALIISTHGIVSPFMGGIAGKDGVRSEFVHRFVCFQLDDILRVFDCRLLGQRVQ